MNAKDTGPKFSAAYAPAAITNFFQISYSGGGASAVGATGGGYVLSKGTLTTATLSGKEGEISTVVNGDPHYNARTTRRTVELLLGACAPEKPGVKLMQRVGTPIGSGFGASAASAVSAVYAVAKLLSIKRPAERLALFAHRAEIIEQTGLGTVSVVYRATGAGAIIRAGEPGKAKFTTVKVPKGTRLVTAFLGPYDKKDALSSSSITARINKLGSASLRRFLSDPKLEVLAEEGERFSKGLGLESPAVKKLEKVAKSAGASHASQNMIGYAVHALTDEDSSEKVASHLRQAYRDARVDVFEVGKAPAGPVPTRRLSVP